MIIARSASISTSSSTIKICAILPPIQIPPHPPLLKGGRKEGLYKLGLTIAFFTFRRNNRQRHSKGSTFLLPVFLFRHCLEGYFSAVLGHYSMTTRKPQSCPLSYLSCGNEGIEY